jgi:F-type H+-transporting ATPase subunit b
MQIDWWTLALQGINFLLLVWLLERFLYRPVKEVIAKRKELAEHAFVEAKTAKEDAEAAGLRFHEARSQLARERQELLKKLHKELETERSKIIEQARDEADGLMEAARTAIVEERVVAISELREEVATLAVDMASSLLRKSGSGISNDVFLLQIEEKLKSLSDDEQERLKMDLAANGTGLTIVTAAPLAPEDEDRWRARIGVCLGQAESTDFVSDPTIIGGVELRFPHALLKFTWADQLEAAKQELCRDDPSAR